MGERRVTAKILPPAQGPERGAVAPLPSGAPIAGVEPRPGGPKSIGANASLQPLIGRYLAKREHQLVRAGFHCPLLLMPPGGGITPAETAIRFPVRLVESGPAGGAIFAACIARQHGRDQVVSFDMGGTTAKICLIDKVQPQTARAFEVARIYRFLKGSGLPLRIPVIEMVEIGAGGGSIARVDTLRRH